MRLDNESLLDFSDEHVSDEEEMPWVAMGSHSLWSFSTLIVGDTLFPEFSSVVMLDDIQVAYYDSNVNNLIYRQFKSEHEDEEQKDASFIFGRPLYDHFSGGTHLFFSAKGVHTLQRLAGCELLDDDTPGPLRLFNAFNGVKDSVLQFNVKQKTLQTEGFWQIEWSQGRKEVEEWMYTNFYSPICIKFLKNWLHMKKNDVMRKVKPRVRLLQKTLPDSGGAKVTCLATGFYPRHINLTLLRDGQPVSDHQITEGELLPNGDETYQMRKSLEVSREELRVKHHYSCTAEHLSLDNKLDVKLDLDPGVGTVSIVIPVVVLGVALLCVVGAVVFMRRRRHSSTL
ncbi:major histocompatibility complex class I-related gene protein-like [Clupea harengus]|uniref:Major histocompatibility complex class I-related gene protein-like n=1 Tax=Clupea harengus TaxID=7950 RepID=A0A6P8FF08_CLUHA|nr:major histocompatibility complex class I-related gene protein-like [Clupea harengus]